MTITPSDIEKKTFSTALRGYDLDEVDDFLDELVTAFRQLHDELADARTRIAQLELDGGAAAVAPAPAGPVPDESAVGRALVAAQEAADRILEEARAEADRIVGAARTEADEFTRERDAKREAVEAEMAEMGSLVAKVRNELAVLATAVADKLDEMDGVVRSAGLAAPGEDRPVTSEAEAAPGAETGQPGEVGDAEAWEEPDQPASAEEDRVAEGGGPDEVIDEGAAPDRGEDEEAQTG